MASKIEEMLANGVSLQEALDLVVKEEKAATKPFNKIEDRVTWIYELNNISELRLAIKSAFGKKSKAKTAGQSAKVEKYQLEVESGQKKLNELLAEVGKAEVRYIKALELGEDIKGAAHLYLTDLASLVETKIAKLDLTNAAIKREVQKHQPSFPKNTPEELRQSIQQRLDNGDMMVNTLFKKVAFIQEVQRLRKEAKATKTDNK